MIGAILVELSEPLALRKSRQSHGAERFRICPERHEKLHELIFPAIPVVFRVRGNIDERVGKPTTRVVNCNDVESERDEHLEPLRACDRAVVALDHQVGPPCDALFTAARLIAVLVDVIVAIDWICEEPDAALRSFAKAIKLASVERETTVLPDVLSLRAILIEDDHLLARLVERV